MSSIKGCWIKIVNVLCICFFFFQMFACINLFIRKIFQDNIVIFALNIIFAVVFYLVYGIINKKININNMVCKIISSDWIQKKFFLFWIIIPFIFKLFLIFLFPISLDSDNRVYMEISRELFHSGMVEQNSEYSLAFPHLFWFGVFLMPANFLGSSEQAYFTYMAVIEAIGAWLLYRSINNNLNWGGNKKEIAFFVMLFYTYLPSQLFTCFSLTHEVMFTFISICTIYFYTLIKKKGCPLIAWTVCCVFVCISKLINPMGIISILALIFTLLFVLDEEEGKLLFVEGVNKSKFCKKVLKLLILFFVIILVSKGTGYIQKKHTIGISSPSNKSYAWTLLVGGDYDNGGRLSSDAYVRLDKYILDKYGTYDISRDQMVECEMEVAIEDWNEIMRNGKLLHHFYHKFCNVWSGTHHTIEFVMRYCSEKWKIYSLYIIMILNNIIWLLFISQVCVNYKIKESYFERSIVVALKTVLIGTAAALLFTEVRNKYNLTMIIPMIIIVAEYTVNKVKN